MSNSANHSTKPRQRNFIQSTAAGLYAFLASYGLSVVLLLLMMLLTFLGTLEQVHQGLYQVQERYFGSLYLVHWFGPVPLPLPGVYLLLILLTINLVFGAVVRARKGWGHIGVFIAHLGIIVLLIGGFMTYEFSTTGRLMLYEGDSAQELYSSREWEVAIAPATASDTFSEFIIPQKQFVHVRNGKTATFWSNDLPFDITLSDYLSSAQVRPANEKTVSIRKPIDGFLLDAVPRNPEAESGIPGVIATVRDANAGIIAETILWGGQRAAWVIEAGGQRWAIDLRPREFPLPFTIKLDKFTRELYPGTEIPKAFKSAVTVSTEEGRRQAVVSMNEPLREQGYTFFQSSWGPSDARPGSRLYSVLAVVKNPAAQMPLYSCIVMCIGLLLHFVPKLLRYMRSQGVRSS